jgi:hypothetical protein
MGARLELHRHFHLAGLLAEYLRRGGVLLRSLRENRVWQFILALAWILIVPVGYYAVHKPFSVNQVQTSERLLIDLLAATALALLAGGLGRRFLSGATLDPVERFAVQAALGWDILGLSWLTAGLLGAFRPWVAWSGLTAAISCPPCPNSSSGGWLD